MSASWLPGSTPFESVFTRPRPKADIGNPLGPLPLLVDQWPLGCRLRSGRRNRERQPGAPARRAVGGIEIAVSSQAQKTLHVSQGEDISDLRTDPENTRPEPAKDRVLTGVIGDLLIGISGNADENPLRDEVRGAPVEVEIDAVAVLRIGIFEIVGKAGRDRELVSGRRIEKGVGAAGVDRAVTDAEIGKPHRIVVAHPAA